MCFSSLYYPFPEFYKPFDFQEHYWLNFFNLFSLIVVHLFLTQHCAHRLHLLNVSYCTLLRAEDCRCRSQQFNFLLLKFLLYSLLALDLISKVPLVLADLYFLLILPLFIQLFLFLLLFHLLFFYCPLKLENKLEKGQ